MTARGDELAARGIRVKPLVWVEDVKGGFMAEGFNSTYRLRQSVSGTWAWQPAYMAIWTGVASLKAAKAAAQADYEARILAALEVTHE